jgi:S-adenosylmethionine:tRNA ribosyltransferase-isomerase
MTAMTALTNPLADSVMGGARRTLPELHPMSFSLPPELEAPSPPESRGMTRDSVRMLVAHKADGSLVHSHFSELPRFLNEGDLIVLNTSGTLAAEIDGIGADGGAVQVHLSTQLPAGLWTVEVRRDGQAFLQAEAGTTIALAGGARVRLLAPYSPGPGGVGVRLWVSLIDTPRATAGPGGADSVGTVGVDSPGGPGALHHYLARHGRPIRYGYVQGSFPITAYQNVYATEPGSAEMPSAGRPFTPEVLTRLVAKGVGIAPLLLHTGVASLEANEPPYAEYFRVTSTTAHRINDTRHRGGRVVAIGTTVVRALESVVDKHGRVHPADGWTQTVVSPDHPVRSIDGFLTGWHEPEASHLAMLEAIAGRSILEDSYAAALAERYLWHEFGDVHLILP